MTNANQEPVISKEQLFAQPIALEFIFKSVRIHTS